VLARADGAPPLAAISIYENATKSRHQITASGIRAANRDQKFDGFLTTTNRFISITLFFQEYFRFAGFGMKIAN